jgi:hypothetical protein
MTGTSATRLRPLTILLLTTAVWATTAAAARAQAVATVTPNAAGKASRLHWAIDGAPAPINGQIPTSLRMATPAGFTMNTKAVAKRCKAIQAKLDECPRKSRIGSATLTIHVQKPSGPRDLPIRVKLYLGRKKSLLAVAFLAGVRVIPGSITASNGIAVTFDPLPTPPAIPQVSYSFIGVTLDLGTSRTVRKKVKGHDKRRKARIHLVKNPQQCASGYWTFASSLGLPDGTTPTFNSPVACTGASR